MNNMKNALLVVAFAAVGAACWGIGHVSGFNKGLKTGAFQVIDNLHLQMAKDRPEDIFRYIAWPIGNGTICAIGWAENARTFKARADGVCYREDAYR